ncbi:hypothetical protein HanRHA438_Chr13g0607941 [Helianthus annuus]|nr:hypothetical protein HanIR_Chr13g0649841 [Helianthus annuus]KAJ0859042.1 hypothetical protein HanRHA438_Chr13g0607941 [Helianthus annuus]
MDLIKQELLKKCQALLEETGGLKASGRRKMRGRSQTPPSKSNTKRLKSVRSEHIKP